MGKVLARFPRNTLVISSKVFGEMSDDVNDRGLSRKHIMESIDRSLRNIGTDYLDIYYCHRYDDETPLEETVRAMDDLIHQGKILYWGTSEWPAARIAEAYGIARQYNLYPPQAEQPGYHMMRRTRVENEVLPVTEPLGIGLTVFSPMANGLLIGQVRRSRARRHPLRRPRQSGRRVRGQSREGAPTQADCRRAGHHAGRAGTGLVPAFARRQQRHHRRDQAVTDREQCPGG